MAEKQAVGPPSECIICWNPFDNAVRTPKLLRCRHTFCIECLAHLRQVASDKSHLQCPLCRHPTELPPGQSVAVLPTDEAVLRLLRLEPNRIVFEGGQLHLPDQRRSPRFLRQPQVSTLDVGTEHSAPERAQRVTPSRPNNPTSRTARQSRHSDGPCNVPFHHFSFLMVIIVIVITLLVFFVFWNNRMGKRGAHQH